VTYRGKTSFYYLHFPFLKYSNFAKTKVSDRLNSLNGRDAARLKAKMQENKQQRVDGER
jgi:hypothetical protein